MFSSISRLWSSEGPASQYNTTDPANDLPATTDICDLEKGADKQSRSLRHLIKLNHANFALVDEKGSGYNCIPDILASAFALNCSPDDLDKLYERAAHDGVVKWTDSPSEVSKLDWTDFLGDHRFQRAFLDFFEDEVVEMGYHWQELTRRYLYFGERPLIQDAMAARGKPLVRLACGLSMSSREVTMEGLALLAVSYRTASTPLSDFKTTPASTQFLSDDPIKVLQKVEEASRTAGKTASSQELGQRFSQSWAVSSVADAMQRAQLVAALLFDRFGSVEHGFRELLDATHGLRFVLVGAPKEFAKTALLSWWQETLALYIKLACPSVNIDEPTSMSGDETWEVLVQKVTNRAAGGGEPRDLITLHTLYSAAKSWPGQDAYLKVARRLGS